MGTITRLNQAKKKLSEAESQMPGAYQNNYADNIRQKLGQLAQASDSFGSNMDPEDARALRNYLYQLQEQLGYVLTNLDTENLSENLLSELGKE